jgi:gamma-glutamyltranspeptidase/glutathione hydrolase
MALQILDALPAATLARPGLTRGHAIAEALRLARAESGARRLATEITEGPLVSEWLTPRWAAAQAARIRPGRAIPREQLRPGAHGLPPTRGTSHLSVVDAAGNAVSLTQSLGRYFGAAWAAPSLGFPLNAFVEPLDSDEKGSPTWLGPGAAAPVAVAPIILVRDGKPVLVAGTGGSSRIPAILLSFLAGVVDGGEEPADACARPRLLWEDDSAGPRVMLEVAPPFTTDDVKALEEMGYENVFTLTEPGSDTAAFGGLHAIARDPGDSSWIGIADGRRPAKMAVPSRIVPPPG